MNVLTLLAFAAAAVSLWRGAARHAGTAARGYRWFAGAAVLWCAGVIVDMAFGGSLTSSGAPLSLLDVAPLLGLGAAAIGVMVLATPDGQEAASGLGTGAGRGAAAGPGAAAGLGAASRSWMASRPRMASARRARAQDGTGEQAQGQTHRRAQGPFPGAVLPGLSDGYVLAVALLVIGWVVAFGAEFHHSGERPGAFLLDLLHPLTDLAVLGALLPVLTTAWRRVAVPYAGLLALTVADSFGVGSRVTGGHEGVLQHLAMILAAAVIGASPWIHSSHPLRGITGVGTGITGAGDRIAGAWTGIASAGAATVIAAAAAVLAAIVVIANGLASAPASGLALVIAGGAAVLVLAWRVLMLVRENGSVLRLWRESGQNLRDLAARTSDAVLICDLSGVIRYASPAAGEYGYLPAQLEGQRLEEFIHPEDLAATMAAARAAIGMPAEGDAVPAQGDAMPADVGGVASADGAEPAGARVVGQAAQDAGEGGHSGPKGRFTCRVRAEDGTWRHVEATVLLFRVPGEPSQLLVTARDISDQVALRQQVTHLTFHDGLTGLPNRAYVEDRARDVLTSTGTASRAGVIFIDIDGFTAVNDSVGHGAGDLVLAQAARRLRAVVPSHDTVARWGSDEFAILVEQTTGSAEIAEIAEKLSAAVAREPFRVANREIALTASVGVALADGDPPGLVLRNADVAMTRARDSGGGRVEVYAAHMHADVVRRLELASDLQQAIAQEQLTLQYQPVVELATSRVTGAEALVRWWRGDESIPPREFLEVAEDSGLIVPLGEWVLREVCSQGASWRAASWDVGVAVNVSLRQLNTPGFTERVAAALAVSGLPPEALTIEVNERVLVEDAGQIVDHLARLRSLGVKLAIDDFGTGYASLAHLRRVPVDIIKIDPSFVAGLGQDETLTMLTRTIVGVGRDLGMEVIAEGIEEPRQLAALREMGCGYGQGFLVARPMAAPRVESLIRTAGNDVSHAEITTGMI